MKRNEEGERLECDYNGSCCTVRQDTAEMVATRGCVQGRCMGDRGQGTLTCPMRAS